MFRYRIAEKKDDLIISPWLDDFNNIYMRAPRKEGLYKIWAQVQDNAFNESKPFYVDYYSKENTGVEIKGKYKSKERVMEIDTKTMEIKKNVEF